MPVNRRLIILAISALVLAFLVNQAINVAQESMHLDARAREAEQPEGAIRAMATAMGTEKATESLEPEKAPKEAYKAEGEPPIILNIALSLIAAAAAFLLIRHTKLNNVLEKWRVRIDQP